MARLGDRCWLGNVLGVALIVAFALLVAVGWASGALLEAVFGDDGAPVDQSVVGYLAEHRSAWLTTAMLYATVLGSAWVLVPLVAVVGLIEHHRVRSWATGAHLALAVGGAIALNNLVKPLVDRSRPPGQLVSTATGYAFPSGHTTQAAAITVTVAILVASALSPSRVSRVTVWSLAVLVSLVVGFSRLYLGVHWATDVLAGYVLGASWAALVAYAIRSCERTPRTTMSNTGENGVVAGHADQCEPHRGATASR